MKRNYTFYLLFALLVSGFCSMSYAADIYLSSTGNDANNGLTPATAVASFSQAQTLAASGDVIHVSGMIDMWSDPANTTFTAITGGFSTTNKTGIVIGKSLTIQGTASATDGFEGKNAGNSTRFFQLTNAAYTLTLKNLKLANGAVESTSVTNGGGAIYMTNGNIVAENVVFDSNTATGNNNITGAALYIGGANTTGTSFVNCVFSNNIASKAGAIYINNWAAGTAGTPNVLKFEGCSFIGNESTLVNGGAALFVRSASNYTTLLLINCTIAKNRVMNTGNGGAVYLGAKAMASTNVHIINCTITENTTAGAAANGAGLYMLNTTANCIGNLYVKNSVIEGNTAVDGTYADLGMAAVSPTTPDGGSSTVPGYIKIENSIIGRNTTPAERVPAENVPAPNHYNYLTDTSIAADLIAKLVPFDSVTNSYKLYVGSAAIDFGNASFLSTFSSTDQLGNTRSFTGGKCFAGSVETTPMITTTAVANNPLSAIRFYKNAANQLVIHSDGLKEGVVSVYNAMGQRVAVAVLKGSETTLEVPQVGVYVLQLSVDGKISSGKVVL